MNDLDKIINDFLEWDISEKDAVALAKHLKGDIIACEKLKKQLALNEILYQTYNNTRSQDSFINSVNVKIRAEDSSIDFLGKLDQKLDLEYPIRSPKYKTFNKFNFIKFAAVAIIILSFSLFFIFSQPKINVISASGTVMKNGEMISDSSVIKTGDIIQTEKNSSFIIQCEDGTTLSMAEKTNINILNQKEGKTFNLVKGSVDINVTPQYKKTPIKIHSFDSIVSVIGTSLNLKSLNNKTFVKVTTGKVCLENNSKSVIIEKGHSVYVNNNKINFLGTVDNDKFLMNGSTVFDYELENRENIPKEFKRYKIEKENLLPLSKVAICSLPADNFKSYAQIALTNWNNKAKWFYVNKKQVLHLTYKLKKYNKLDKNKRPYPKAKFGIHLLGQNKNDSKNSLSLITGSIYPQKNDSWETISIPLYKLLPRKYRKEVMNSDNEENINWSNWNHEAILVDEWNEINCKATYFTVRYGDLIIDRLWITNNH